MMTDHMLETTREANMFTNFCADAEQDTLQQDAGTAVQTEADTGLRTTRKI